MLKRKMIKNFSWPLKTATRGKEFTRLYPEVMMELPAAERGIHELDATKCIGCASCARICPNSCIEMVPYKFGNPMKNKKLQMPQIDYGRCMFCGLCVDECPVECLKMGKKVTMAGWERKDIVKGPGDLAVKKFSAKEVAELEAEAKRVAAEKAAAAAAKKKAAPKEGAEGAGAAKNAAPAEGAGKAAAAAKVAARKKEAAKAEVAVPKAAENKTEAPKEGGAS
ncbi:MAG: 4Fe-4S binding protein [Methanotrichaceae archaeon]